MSLPVALWLFAVAIGPVLLGGAIAYGKFRERRYSRQEQAESRASVERLYDDESDDPEGASFDSTPNRRQEQT